MFNIIHNEWVIKADFIVKKVGEYRQMEFDRRKEIIIEGTPISFVTAEDLILSKLEWGRESNSELQQRDVIQLLKSTRDLDWTYLKNWAKKLDLMKRLEDSKK